MLPVNRKAKVFWLGKFAARLTTARKNRTADLMEPVADLDDLVMQFDGTDAGKRFIEAWKRARIIVDTGGHSGTPPTPPTPPNK
jgi:hypothetical protein